MKCPKCKTEINPAAMLGSIKSAAKAKSSRENGKLGGRPKKMKSIIAIATLMLAATAMCAEKVNAVNSVSDSKPIDVNRLCHAIFLAEGGDKARVPYGVLSVKVKDKADARRITINSINNNIKRWEKAGKRGTFVDFMADRWCPVASDPVGNRNWKKNVKAIYNTK